MNNGSHDRPDRLPVTHGLNARIGRALSTAGTDIPHP